MAFTISGDQPRYTNQVIRHVDEQSAMEIATVLSLFSDYGYIDFSKEACAEVSIHPSESNMYSIPVLGIMNSLTVTCVNVRNQRMLVLLSNQFVDDATSMELDHILGIQFNIPLNKENALKFRTGKEFTVCVEFPEPVQEQTPETPLSAPTETRDGGELARPQTRREYRDDVGREQFIKDRTEAAEDPHVDVPAIYYALRWDDQTTLEKWNYITRALDTNVTSEDVYDRAVDMFHQMFGEDKGWNDINPNAMAAWIDQSYQKFKVTPEQLIDKDTTILSESDGIIEVAKTAYSKYSNNHPTIHCNRFPSWYELSVESREKWILDPENPGVEAK